MNEDDDYCGPEHDSDFDCDDEDEDDCDSDREPYSGDEDGPMSYPQDGDDYMVDGVGFADPGGNSALRAATRSNPRNLPCPNCNSPTRLTPADKRAGYQCDSCADKAEGGWGHGEY